MAARAVARRDFLLPGRRMTAQALGGRYSMRHSSIACASLMVFAVLAMTTNHAAAWRRDVVIRLLDGRTMNANDPAAVKACLDQGGKVETGHNGAKICMPGLTKNGNITLK